MDGPIALPPVRISGAYYTLTYQSGLDPSVLIRRNGVEELALTGKTARHYISLLEQTNAYDTLVDILDEHYRGGL